MRVQSCIKYAELLLRHLLRHHQPAHHAQSKAERHTITTVTTCSPGGAVHMKTTGLVMERVSSQVHVTSLLAWQQAVVKGSDLSRPFGKLVTVTCIWLATRFVARLVVYVRSGCVQSVGHSTRGTSSRLGLRVR